MTDQEYIIQAQQAKELQENPFLTKAIESWTKEITQVWSASQLKDAEGREKLYLMLTAAKQFQTYIQSAVDSGTLLTASSQGLYSTRGPV
jgi:hypothetical protein